LSREPAERYISGFGISIETDSAKGKGAAGAFIRKIEFLKWHFEFEPLLLRQRFLRVIVGID